MDTKPEDAAGDVYSLISIYTFSFSDSGLITRMNPAFLAALGYGEEEIVGKKKLSGLLTVGSKIFFQTHFFPLIKLHGKFSEIMLSFLSHDGKEIPVLMNAALAGNEAAFEIHCGGMHIAQRNRFEKEIIEARKIAEKALSDNEALTEVKKQLEQHQELLEMRLQQLSQRVAEQQQINMLLSHDLQEPLRKISIFSDQLLVEDHASIDAGAAQTLQKIRQTVDKMRRLVVSMQSYLSIDEKRYLPVKLSLEAAVRAALAKVRIEKETEGVHLHIDALPELAADYPMIITLFSELLSNSLKFRDKNKAALEISISSDVIEQNIFVEMENRYKYKEYLRLIYKDNGIGFDNAFAEEIFVPFRKAHDAEEGLGIGLSHCKKIVELHKGTISARSMPGQGAAFTILFPAFGDQ